MTDPHVTQIHVCRIGDVGSDQGGAMTRETMGHEASALLVRCVRHVLSQPKNRAKGIPTESPEQLLRMAQDEIDEALHALRCGRGVMAALTEIGDAGAYLAMAAWRLRKSA